MGMTEKQFNGFLRLLFDALESVTEEQDEQKKEKKLKKTMEHIRDMIED